MLKSHCSTDMDQHKCQSGKCPICGILKGGVKRGRKKVPDTLWLKYKNNTSINQININICRKMTVRQLRDTALYRKLYFDPQNRPRRSGKGGDRFGFKSYLNKEELCKYLSNPSKYEQDLNNIYNKQGKKRAGPRIRPTRAGNCIPKERLPNNRKCDNKSFPHIGKTSSNTDCCYKKKQNTTALNKSKNRITKLSTGKNNLQKFIASKEANASKRKIILNFLKSTLDIETLDDLNRYKNSSNTLSKKLKDNDSKLTKMSINYLLNKIL